MKELMKKFFSNTREGRGTDKRRVRSLGRASSPWGGRGGDDIRTLNGES